MPREVPDSSYYPGARLRLVIRFDEFGATDTPAPPTTISTLRAGIAAGVLEIQNDGNALVLGAQTADPGKPGAPQKVDKSKDGRTHVIEGIIPKTCSLHRNGIRTADTLTASIRFADLPIDPRVVRAVAVELYMGCMPEADFQGGVAGGAFSSDGGPNEGPPLNIVADTFIDDAGATRSNLRFSGWADEYTADFDEDDEPVIQLECTDNTRLLIDQEAPPKLTIGAKTPLDKAIATYLSNFPQFRGLAVEYRPAGEDIPQLDSALAKTAFKPTLGPAPAGGGGSSKLNVWDYLTDVCGAVGHTVRVEGVTIVIQKARTIYGRNFPQRPDDPWKGRKLPSGRTLLVRTFIYGRNLSTLRFKRKFARFVPQNIEVRSYSTKQKKTLVARYPQKGDRQKRLLTGDSAEEKWMVKEVTGVEDEKTLRAYAQGIYEAIGRNELETELETHDLGSFGGSNLDPDALDIEAGDTVDVEVNREEDIFMTVASTENAITTRAAAFLQALGYSTEFAQAYATAVANIGYPTTFRVKDASFDWECDEDGEPGIKIHLTLTNYLEVRSDKELPDGEEPDAPAANNQSPTSVEVSDEI